MRETADRQLRFANALTQLHKGFFSFLAEGRLLEGTYEALSSFGPLAGALSDSGSYDSLTQSIAALVHPSECETFLKRYCRDSLLISWARGETDMSSECRVLGADNVYHYVRMRVMFAGPREGDELVFWLCMSLMDEEQAAAENARASCAILARITQSYFELVARVDILTGCYELAQVPGEAIRIPKYGEYARLLDSLASLCDERSADDLRSRLSLRSALRKVRAGGDVKVEFGKIEFGTYAYYTARFCALSKNELLLSVYSQGAF